MGLFDFLKTKAPPPPPSEEEEPANAPKGKQPQGDKTGVPEGHEVTFHHAMAEPSVIGGSPIPQAAYLVDASPAIRPFARLVRGLGLIVKQPDDQESGPLLMAEIKRPDGPILCLMAGKPHPADERAWRRRW